MSAPERMGTELGHTSFGSLSLTVALSGAVNEKQVRCGVMLRSGFRIRFILMKEMLLFVLSVSI